MPAPYSDLHLHLLPNVDDGPSDMEETLALARYLSEDGVTRAVVTPHFNTENPSRLFSIEDLLPRLEKVRNALETAEIEIELHPGAEHYLTPDLLPRAVGREVPLLGSGPYILVELPFRGGFPAGVADFLGRFVDMGVMPVLAHPERYSWVQSHPEAALRLLGYGVALQCTAGSLGGSYGDRVQKVARHILLEGGYQLVGSDLHRAGQPRLLSRMEEMVMDLAGAQVAHTIFVENQNRVLQGEELLPVPRTPENPIQRRLFGQHES